MVIVDHQYAGIVHGVKSSLGVRYRTGSLGLTQLSVFIFEHMGAPPKSYLHFALKKQWVTSWPLVCKAWLYIP
ncbi:hypothetical protein R50072_33980 [Simiduia litorea]